jgi:hypothetical protein
LGPPPALAGDATTHFFDRRGCDQIGDLSSRKEIGNMLRTLKLGLPLLILIVTGCGGGSSSVSSFHPTGTSAKTALTKALDAWKSGQEKPGKIENSKPVIEAQDSVWGTGRKLKDFQIGDEQKTADGPTRFKVQLTFDGDPANEDAEYVVFGKDPLYVFRDKDYQKMSGQ